MTNESRSAEADTPLEIGIIDHRIVDGTLKYLVETASAISGPQWKTKSEISNKPLISEYWRKANSTDRFLKSEGKGTIVEGCRIGGVNYVAIKAEGPSSFHIVRTSEISEISTAKFEDTNKLIDFYEERYF